MIAEIKNEAGETIFDPLDEECIRGYQDTKIICMNVRHDYTRTLESDETPQGGGNEGDSRVRDGAGWSLRELLSQAIFPNGRKVKAPRAERDSLEIGAPKVSSGHIAGRIIGWGAMAASLALSVGIVLTKKEVWYALIPSGLVLSFIHINL
ncbi:hypothetical protein KGP36_01580 [Patescibacteria group bacterium]|nr:hypothetical protein [Patescibacteria group bacterium]